MNDYQTLVLWDEESQPYLDDIDIYTLDGSGRREDVLVCYNEATL